MTEQDLSFPFVLCLLVFLLFQTLSLKNRNPILIGIQTMVHWPPETLHKCMWNELIVAVENPPFPPSPLLSYHFLHSVPLALGTKHKCFRGWLMFKGRESDKGRAMPGCSTDKQIHLLFFPKPTRCSQKTVTHPAVDRSAVLPAPHSDNCAILL